MRRADLAANVEVDSAFSDPPHEQDIILGVKLFLASESYAQKLQVFCPNSAWECLPPEGPGVAQQGAFSAVEQQEFRKTAAAISKAPWCMHRAAKVLLEAASGQAGGSPPAVPWVFHPVRPQ
eukprot:12703036-Alexandrium_andersonii.AAC.1